MNLKILSVVMFVVGILLGLGIGYSIMNLQNTTVTKNQGISVIAAGSLGYAFNEIAQNWSSLYPGIPITPGGGIFMGSVRAADEIAVLHEHYDIFASAASDVIPMVLYPKYAQWMVLFATNEISILYAPNSNATVDLNGTIMKVDQINETNWFMFITAPGVTVGVSNGSTDPAGFQAIQAMKLAGIYLVENDNKAYNEWFHGVLGYPLNDTNAIFEAIWWHKYKTGHLMPVGIEASMDAMIKTGKPYFGISYRSLAKSYGLGYVELPWQINLGSTNITAINYYAQVNSSGAPIGLSGTPSEASAPAGPIFYAVTIPSTATNVMLAIDYLTILLGPIGHQVLINTYFDPLPSPYLVLLGNNATFPSVLLPYVQPLPEYLQSGPGYIAVMGTQS
ncbi:MAG: substrate-binding domain-containing protein [Thermoplasmata archaeon]|jgi:molybdate/tungstate transport system substrate-binding protein